ncbi:MAG: hypothetical protein KQJ78_12405 [Deltaproteobacteria bacterium]|nr:hypothetical protein [Deltaproteobacteria bacterium]
MTGALTGSRLADSLNRVLTWAQGQDYAGYSKFDVFNSPVMRALSLNNQYLRMFMAPAWARSPINLRPLVFTEKSRNPKGIALFALAYLHRYQAQGQKADLAEAEILLTWLKDHACQGYSGMCWGYDHAWQNLRFYAPKYCPNIVVTGNISYAFLKAHEITGDPEHLAVARSSVDFILKDLEAPINEPTMRNIGYIPGSTWAVLNINGLAATILGWVGSLTREPELSSEARRLMAFLVDKQTPEGAWYYAWPAKSAIAKIDNYHTGNVLDWLLEYSRHTGDAEFLPRYDLGLAFYRRHLFLPDGAPKWMSDKDFPQDVHGAAQAVVTFVKAAQWRDPTCRADAERTAAWALDNMQTPQGWFYYQKGRHFTKRYTLMRWCNAWMAYALGLLMTLDSTGEASPEKR